MKSLYSPSPVAASKIIARHMGITGREGGWLYRNQLPVCHGWERFSRRCIDSGMIVQRQVNGGTRYAIVWAKVPHH